MNTSPPPAPVWIVEDDTALADSLQLLLGAAGLTQTRHFPSADACLLALPKAHALPRGAGCMLLDIRLGTVSGIELFAKLRELEWSWPVIFMTGHGDLQMAVDLVKQGAFDFVTKPFDPMKLAGRLREIWSGLDG